MLATSLLTTRDHVEFALEDLFQAEAKVRLRRMRMLERAGASKLHREAAFSQQAVKKEKVKMEKVKKEKVKQENAVLKVEAKVEVESHAESEIDEMEEVDVEEEEPETPQLSNEEMFALKGQSLVADAASQVAVAPVASDDEDVAVDDYGRSLTALLLLTRLTPFQFWVRTQDEFEIIHRTSENDTRNSKI